MISLVQVVGEVQLPELRDLINIEVCKCNL